MNHPTPGTEVPGRALGTFRTVGPISPCPSRKFALHMLQSRTDCHAGIIGVLSRILRAFPVLDSLSIMVRHAEEHERETWPYFSSLVLRQSSSPERRCVSGILFLAIRCVWVSSQRNGRQGQTSSPTPLESILEKVCFDCGGALFQVKPDTMSDWHH